MNSVKYGLTEKRLEDCLNKEIENPPQSLIKRMRKKLINKKKALKK